jgi:isopenicillin N synthase-like dioxygenase
MAAAAAVATEPPLPLFAEVDALRMRGWCLLPLDTEKLTLVQSAHKRCAEFFALPTADKLAFHGGTAAAATSAVGCDADRRHSRSHDDKAAAYSSPLQQYQVQAVPSAFRGVVGYLRGDTREWWHLAVGLLERVHWPTTTMRSAVLDVLDLLQRTALGMLGAASVAAATAHAEQSAQRGDASVLDLFHYHNRGFESDVNMGSHADPGLLTVTPCSEVPGLELLDQATLSWVDIEALPEAAHSLVLFTGDGVEEFTGGAWRATTHRVRTADRARLSIVYEMRLWDYEGRSSCSTSTSSSSSKGDDGVVVEGAGAGSVKKRGGEEEQGGLLPSCSRAVKQQRTCT